MKPSVIGGLIGAFIGMMFILATKIFVVMSTPVLGLLWPTRFFMTAFTGFGPFGHMMLDTVAIFASILLYAIVGYVVGWLFSQGGNA